MRTVTLLWLLLCSCTVQGKNLARAIELADNAFEAHFSETVMARYYDPYTGERSNEVGSIWMYTSAIEAVNAILHALPPGSLFDRYAERLERLYDGADYYLGTFTLTSYTQTKEWTVYAVHRAAYKGGANVEGVENVYDDQMWLIRELLKSYMLTGKERYLEKAEYLAEYVLDGWDCTLDAHGNEAGGIPWGPGYVTKHACSNGPVISPLVWLHELYKGKDDETTRRYIDGKARKTERVKKRDYYLAFAEKIYDWQKRHLLREDGVYSDMMGGCTPGKPELETIGGVVYRKGIICRDRGGEPYSYNSGSMLSGAADLYRATGNKKYLTDGKKLADASFAFFAKKREGGFGNWFNGVLMRGYVDFYPSYGKAGEYIDPFQKNLDYGYEHFLHNGFLPSDLRNGWGRNNNTEGMFSFAFAAEYARLARYESDLAKSKNRHACGKKKL